MDGFTAPIQGPGGRRFGVCRRGHEMRAGSVSARGAGRRQARMLETLAERLDRFREAQNEPWLVASHGAQI